MRLQKYDIDLIYVPGKNLLPADTLSRAYLPTTEGRHSDFEQVHALQHLAITYTRLEAIREATDADEVMTTLKNTILHGWPEEKPQVHRQVQGYFSFRDELSVYDSIVFKGERGVVPTSQRSILKEKLHSSHLGVDGCLRRAKECLFLAQHDSRYTRLHIDMQHLSYVRSCKPKGDPEKSRRPIPTMGEDRNRHIHKRWQGLLNQSTTIATSGRWIGCNPLMRQQ